MCVCVCVGVCVCVCAASSFWGSYPKFHYILVKEEESWGWYSDFCVNIFHNFSIKRYDVDMCSNRIAVKMLTDTHNV